MSHRVYTPNLGLAHGPLTSNILHKYNYHIIQMGGTGHYP